MEGTTAVFRIPAGIDPSSPMYKTIVHVSCSQALRINFTGCGDERYFGPKSIASARKLVPCQEREVTRKSHGANYGQ